MIRTLPAAALVLLPAACGGGAPAGNDAAPPPGNLADAVPTANEARQLPPPASVNPALYLPPAGTYQARAVAVAAPAEMQALAARISAGVRANQQWYREYARANPAGELPWHPNFGVSEAEYGRFMALSRQLTLRELERVTLTVARRADGGLALTATGQAAQLNGIVVYPERDRAETPLGPLTRRDVIDNQDEASPTGPWRGVQWDNRGATPGYPIQVAFGRRRDQGDFILYYDFGPSDRERVTLLFRAPAGAGGAR